MSSVHFRAGTAGAYSDMSCDANWRSSAADAELSSSRPAGVTADVQSDVAAALHSQHRCAGLTLVDLVCVEAQSVLRTGREGCAAAAEHGDEAGLDADGLPTAVPKILAAWLLLES